MIALLRKIPVSFVISVLAGLLFIPFLGAVRLFDWDEINFAECAREMLVTGDFLRISIDYSPFWEKPPLFIWLQAASMSVFGVNEFAARLPNALIGVATLLLLYRWGCAVRSQQFGILWAAAYAGSFLPHFYFRSAIIDPLFNLLIFAGMMTLAGAPANGRYKSAGIAGMFTGLAMLTKGPVAMLVIMLTIAAVSAVTFLQRKRVAAIAGQSRPASPGFRRMRVAELIVFAGVSATVASLWFGVDILNNGTWFVTEFVRYQVRLLTTGDAGHSGPFYYHALVLLFGCFPASVFALSGLFRTSGDERFRLFRLWNIVLFSVTLVLFSIVKTKIIHYSSLCYFPIAFLAADWLDGVLDGRVRWKKRQTAAIGFFGLLWGSALAAVPVIGLFKESLTPFIRDEVARANLTANVVWQGWEPGIGILYICVVVAALFQQEARRRITLLFASTCSAIVLFLPVIAPKIEGYTQAAAVDFYERLQGRGCYVIPVGYKSYAHLYYTRKQPDFSPSAAGIASGDFEQWLLEGHIDKPAYFVCKVNNAGSLRRRKNLREIGDKAGYVFFERLPE
jgi:4-amino-4-deoxy-L-arabinose transferase-like glycosyltransferase